MIRKRIIASRPKKPSKPITSSIHRAHIRIVFLTISVFALVSLFASFIQPIAPQNIRGVTTQRYTNRISSEVIITKNITYGQATAVTGRQQTLLMDIVEPKGDTYDRRPVIIWIHGGGFFSGSKDGMTLVASEYAKYGFVSVPIDYRFAQHAMTPQTPGVYEAAKRAQEDTFTAIRYIRSNADKYRIDPDRIIIAGFSAGAMTALYAAYDTANIPASGTPNLNRPVAAVVSVSGGMLPEHIRTISAGDPPAILVHGVNDAIVPISMARSVDQRLSDLGIAHKLITHSNGHTIEIGAQAHSQIRSFLALNTNLTSDTDTPITPNATITITPSSTPSLTISLTPTHPPSFTPTHIPSIVLTPILTPSPYATPSPTRTLIQRQEAQRQKLIRLFRKFFPNVPIARIEQLIDMFLARKTQKHGR